MAEETPNQPISWPGPVIQHELPVETETVNSEVGNDARPPRRLVRQGITDPELSEMWDRETPVELLTWMWAREEPGIAVIACAGAEDLRVPREHTYLGAPDCWGELSPALPALLMAFGADHIKIWRCPRCRENTPKLWSMWRSLYGDQVEFCDCGGKRRVRRTSCIAINDAPLPRRFALGIGALEEPPFEYREVDEVTRFNNARRFLREHGRALYIDRLNGANGGKDQAEGQEPAEKASGKRKYQPHSNPELQVVPDEYSGPLPHWSSLLDVDPNLCVSCPVCSRGCPEGALQLVTSGKGDTEETALVHFPLLCRSCESCVELCPEGAIASGGKRPWRKGNPLPEQPRALNRQRTTNCKMCGFKIPASQGELCEHCRYRQENPFGFRLPPGMKLEDLSN